MKHFLILPVYHHLILHQKEYEESLPVTKKEYRAERNILFRDTHTHKSEHSSPKVLDQVAYKNRECERSSLEDRHIQGTDFR